MLKLIKLFFQIIKQAMSPENIQEKMDMTKKYNEIKKKQINEEYEKLKRE